jgi:hypothetical protein
VHTDENMLTSQQGYYYMSDTDGLSAKQYVLSEFSPFSPPATEHKHAHQSIIVTFSRHLKQLCLLHYCVPLPAYGSVLVVCTDRKKMLHEG